MASKSVKQRPDGKWRARYRDAEGKEHAKHFPRKVDAQRWLDEVTAAVVTGAYIDPKDAKTTVGEWCDVWLKGYSSKRPATVRCAKVHLKRIKAKFGDRTLVSIRSSEVKSWTAEMKEEGLAQSTIHGLHARLGQIFSDAVHDGLIPKSPCSRRTSPPAGKQRPYVATTKQVWALYEAMEESARPAILLGAFAGLRVAEAVALRATDVDFLRGVISPEVQYPDVELKTETSRTPIPIPRDLAGMLNANLVKWGSETIVTNEWGRGMWPSKFEAKFRDARVKVEGLPEGFRFHDLRHYFASLLIHRGLDIKTVQKCLRHASAKTTLDTYGHMWPDRDESTREAVQSVLAARADSLRTDPATSAESRG